MELKDMAEMRNETKAILTNDADPEALLEADEALNSYQYGENPYFILQECESNAERIRLLQKLGGLAQKRSVSNQQETQAYVCYLNVEGSYFPDFMEEDGCFLASAPFLEYLKYKFDVVPVTSCRIALVAEEGRRIEEYALLQLEELDCTIAESAIYNDQQVLEYFELDAARIRTYEIYKVKDFPHPVVAKKLNRIEFAGVQCVRIDRYFDYAAKQAQLRQAQLTAEQPEQLLKRLEEAAATGREKSLVREFKQQVLDQVIEYDFNRGLRLIFDSLKRQALPNQESMIDLELVWSWERQECELTEGQAYFTTTRFTFKYLSGLKKAWKSLPEALQPLGRKLAAFTVRKCAQSSLVIIERYVKMNIKRKFRLCLREAENLCATPDLIYEMKGQSQGKPEIKPESSGLEWNHRDLHAEDLSGKKLAGLKIEGSNLTRVKFHGSQLNQVEFQHCDLTGAEFDGAILTETKFSDCKLDQARFTQAELKDAVIERCSLEHTGFSQSKLSGVKLTAESLFGAYFYRAKLIGAVIMVPGPLTGCVFRLCDLRNAQFIGDQNVFDNNLEDCDFRSADLSGCRIATRGVARCRFEGAKLVEADFSGCKEIVGCNFKYSKCNAMNLEGVWVLNNDFTRVDLSRLTPNKGILFKDNDFSYASLEGHDFTAMEYSFPNRLIYTNLTQCQLAGYDLTSSYLLYPALKDANLKEVVLDKGQMQYLKLSSLQKREIIEDSEDEDDEK